MEKIKELILSLPLDWVFHGMDVSIGKLVLVGAVVLGICAGLALVSGKHDRKLHRRFDNGSGMAYPSIMMRLCYAALRKISRGEKGWYCISAAREYSLARISVTLVTLPYFITYMAAHNGGSFIMETVEHMESSVTPWWVGVSIVFFALTVIVSLVHKSFFMTLAVYLSGGYFSFMLMCLCGKIGVWLINALPLLSLVWVLFVIVAFIIAPILQIFSCLFRLVFSRNGEGDFSISIPVGEDGGAAEALDRDTGSDAVSDASSEPARLPTIIYDDQNCAWYKQYMAGDAAVYQKKESGERVTIYSAEISGSGANTDAGYFHWY